MVNITLSLFRLIIVPKNSENGVTINRTHVKHSSLSGTRIVCTGQNLLWTSRRSNDLVLYPICRRACRITKLLAEWTRGFGSGHLWGLTTENSHRQSNKTRGVANWLETYTNRLNWGHVAIGFLQSACWLVRYSVIMESSVIRGWSMVEVDSVVGVLDSFISGSFNSFFWSREFCVGVLVCRAGVDFLQKTN